MPDYSRTRPTVSVIVIAHDRRDYIVEAVRSVAAQDLPRDRFEIIVAKYFEDPQIDAELARLGADLIVCKEIPASSKALAGAQRARGPILCFLDDDDLFEPEKLNHVVAAFEAHPDLGFYRNRFTTVGADGLPLPADSARAFGLRPSFRSRSLFLSSEAKAQVARELVGQFPDFNISAGAVRREVVERALPCLAQIDMTVDTLLFFSALTSEYSLLMDEVKLSRYRVHDSNSTRSGTGPPEERLARLRRFAQREQHDYKVIRDFVAKSGPSPYLQLIDARLWVSHLTEAFRSPNASRRDFVRLLAGLPPYLDTYPIREHVLGLTGILPFLVSPRLGRRLYHRQVSVR